MQLSAHLPNRLPVKKTNHPNAVNRLKVNVDGDFGIESVPHPLRPGALKEVLGLHFNILGGIKIQITKYILKPILI